MSDNPNVLRVARFALALLFIVTGTQKLLNPERMAPLFSAMGMPESLGFAVGAFEVVAGIAFIAAFWLRLLAPALAAWCLLTGLIGHPFWSEPSQLSGFLKNVGLAGSFLLFCMPPRGRNSSSERTL